VAVALADDPPNEPVCWLVAEVLDVPDDDSVPPPRVVLAASTVGVPFWTWPPHAGEPSPTPSAAAVTVRRTSALADGGGVGLRRDMVP
jgi:hypothetical protein